MLADNYGPRQRDLSLSPINLALRRRLRILRNFLEISESCLLSLVVLTSLGSATLLLIRLLATGG